MTEAEKVWEACCASENGGSGPDSVVIIAQALREARAEGIAVALKEAVLEVQGWRELTIMAHKECAYSNPKEADREHRNTLNLLGVIESKLRAKVVNDPILMDQGVELMREHDEKDAEESNAKN